MRRLLTRRRYIGEQHLDHRDFRPESEWYQADLSGAARRRNYRKACANDTRRQACDMANVTAGAVCGAR